MFCEKAVQLNAQLHGDENRFVAWKWQFCRRHGIRNLSTHGEKVSADQEASSDFVSSFSKNENLSLDQIFNCDETLPLLSFATSLAASFANGGKKTKDGYSKYASGTIKLPLHLIGKSKRPRCFKGVKIH